MAFDTEIGIPYKIDIDIHNITKFEKIYAKQYDKESRYVEATLFNSGDSYTIPLGATAIFGCKKRSTKIVESPATIQDNKVYYRLEEQVTAVDGEVEAEITLTFNGVTLGCPKFKIIVEKAAVDASDIADNDDVNILTSLIVDATEAITNTETATSNANTATGNAVTATNTAIAAATNANDKATLANTKAGLADTATLNANNATTNAIAATTNANNARYLGDYVAGTTYQISNIVRYQNALYICKTVTMGNLPTNTTYWDISSKQFAWKDTYVSAIAYTALDAVSYLGSSYICIQASTGNLPTNATYFSPLALKGDKGATLSPKGNYIAEVTYVKDDLVNNNESVWQCLQTVKGVIPSEGVNWTIFLTGGGAIGDLGILKTDVKTTAVDAINENHDKIGDLSQLATTSNTDLVGAVNEVNSQLADIPKFQTAGGTGTAIILIGLDLVDGHSKTFIAKYNNGGAATTINGKPFYKPGTTTTPSLVAGKAYTVWYDATGDCFFIKASHEGNTVAAHVLDGETFSNDADTGLIGTMPNRDYAWQNPVLTEPHETYLYAVPPAGWYAGSTDYVHHGGLQIDSADFRSANILSERSIFGLAGSVIGVIDGNASPGNGVSVALRGGSSYTFFPVTVSGLTAKPKRIIMMWKYQSNTAYTIYDPQHRSVYPETATVVNMRMLGSESIVVRDVDLPTGPFYVNSSGFCLPAFSQNPVNWYIFG